MFILAQIFGLLGAISLLLSSWQKTKDKVLTFLILDSIFYSMQYLLLGALSGTFTNIVGIIRAILFKYKDKNKILQNNIMLYIIILIYIVIGIITYNDVISLFPIIASIFYSALIWQNKVNKIRIGNCIMNILWIVYNIYVSAYIGAIMESVILLSSIVAIIKIDILKNIKQFDK